VKRLHPVTQTVLTCFVASLAAPFVVILVFRDVRPLVGESFVISFAYSMGIAFVSRALGPAVIKRIGKPGWKLTLALSIALIVSAAIGSLAGGVVLLAIGFVTAAQFWTSYFFLVRIAAALAVVSGLGSYFYETLTSQLREAQAQLQEKEIEQERAKKIALEARLSSLESRIHPHFLFNTLNSISALIHVNPGHAERIVGKLAALLRGSLNSTQKGLIPLESELSIVCDYLEIEKARFGERLQYSLDVCAGAGDVLVPPFSVQSIVENSIKHGIGPQEDGGRIEIAAQFKADGLCVAVRDTGPGFDLSGVNPGYGLDNVISRLETLFGSAARLEVERSNNCCVVSLWIPVKVMEAVER
jgi:two-component system sensor histidine kinase AlgZ